MKKLSLLVIAIIAFVNLFAQDCTLYLPGTEGAVLKYNSYDKKDKLSGSYTQQVKNITSTTTKTEATVAVTYYDKKNEEYYTNEIDVWCENGVYYLDMESYLNGAALSSYQEMDVKIDATNLNFPAGLKVGDKLSDGDLKVTVLNSGIQIMAMTTKVHNRIVESKEEVTTQAGTFECYKISYDIMAKAIVAVNMKSTDWYSPEVGMVKSESYNSNGKKTGSTELVSITK